MRMTTRYTEAEFLSSLMGILHETGHGLYEQGLPKEWSHWPVGKARGMAIHESQSLFVEKQIAAVGRVLGMGDAACARASRRRARIAGWDLEDVLAHVHLIERGLIRVDADEATYPLHVILRFETRAGPDRAARSRPRMCPKPGTPRCASIWGSRPSTT